MVEAELFAEVSRAGDFAAQDFFNDGLAILFDLQEYAIVPGNFAGEVSGFFLGQDANGSIEQ